MSQHESGQVATGAATVYEQFFVPALFGEWPEKVVAAADVQPGHKVLDVACGTGILAREAARVTGRGEVVGVDINEGMLAVAESKAPDIDWKKGAAEALPFENDSFDRVISQFALMFFEDKVTSISEMLRVVRPQGLICVAVWDSLDNTPGYATVVEILTELFGPEVAKSIEVPYSLGDTTVLKRLFADAGARSVDIETQVGTARFPSVESWIYTDIKAWTLADVIDDAGYEKLKREAPKLLSGFELQDGSVEFAAPAHLITATP